MAITFTTQQRLDLTRRQLKIAQENSAYSGTQSNLTAQKQQLLNVDNVNANFYNFQTSQVSCYETEGRSLNGTIAATYTDGVIDPYSPGDLSTSAKSPASASATFYPNTPPYTYFVPKQIDAVNGFAHPTGTDNSNENTQLTNLSVDINRLVNGITASTSGNTSSAISVPGGNITGFLLEVADSTGFNVNDYVYISGSGHSGIYQITHITPGSLGPPIVVPVLTINSILPSTAGIPSSASVKNIVAGFTNTERQNLTSASYQEILTNLTNEIATYVSSWKTNVNSQISSLNAQQETRSIQISENASALASDNNAISVINTWQALSNTGVGGKYTNTGLSPLNAEISTRQSYVTSRISQITTALGSVTVSGNDYTGPAGSPYFERYKWLNNRINTASGSARRFFAADEGINFIAVLANNNTVIQNDYDKYFLTKAITANSNSTIIQISDIIGLSVGDIITVVSETQPEITRAIMDIQGTTQLKLDAGIPNSYLVSDLARIFKTL
jgi:hypothetical protein